MQCLHKYWIFVSSKKTWVSLCLVMNGNNLAIDKTGKPNNFWFTVWIFNEIQNAIKDEWSGALLHQTFFCVKFYVHWWGKTFYSITMCIKKRNKSLMEFNDQKVLLTTLWCKILKTFKIYLIWQGKNWLH